MKKLFAAMIAVAAVAVAAPASAALLCKNSIGQEIRWQAGWPKPVLLANDSGDAFKSEAKDFDVSKDVLCFVSNYAYVLATQIPGLPYIPGIPAPGTNVPGVIYRGDLAKFLLENLPGMIGQYAIKQDAFDRKP